MPDPALPAAARDRWLLWLRRLSLACVVLMLIVVVSSAWLRLAQLRPVCDGWPGCRSAAAAELRSAAAPWMGSDGVMAVVRGTHRSAASAMLPATVALALLALSRRPRLPTTGQRALAMLGLALALAALGVVTPGSRSPGVMLGNHLGGLLLLAITWTCWRGLAGGVAATPQVAGWARRLALLWLLQAALGGWSGAGFGGPAALLHLALAAPAVLGAFALGMIGQRQRCSGALALTLAAAAQPLLGVAAMLSAAPPALVLLHNAVAALGLALLWGLATRGTALALPVSAAPEPVPY